MTENLKIKTDLNVFEKENGILKEELNSYKVEGFFFF
jgi:hypothetical protein